MKDHKGGRRDLRQDVEAVLPRIVKVVSDSKLSRADLHYIAEVLVMRRELLRDLHPDPQVAQSYWRALKSLNEIDAKSMFSELKALREAILSEGFRSRDNSNDIGAFKQLRDGSNWKLLVTPLIRLAELPGMSREEHLRRYIQWVSFDSRLNLASVDYSHENAIQYLDQEFVISHEPIDWDLLTALSRIAEEWFRDFTPEINEPDPYFSGGATAELKRTEATPRNKVFTMTFDRDCISYMRYRTGEATGDIDCYVPPCGLKLVSELPPCRVRFVPKNPLTNRVVSCEPTGRIWLQQDFFRTVRKYVLDRGIQITLMDQRISRELARRGSVAGSYTTVDLSSGSDYIRWSHVQFIFKNTTLNPMLGSIRSKKSSVTYRENGVSKTVMVPLEKFAPMGSSQCFLMMSIVLALACELAVRRCKGRSSMVGDYAVCGDDIVIRTDCFSTLRIILALMRMRVNDTKTFSDISPLTFREACGIEAVNGIDVTPLRLSRRYRGLYAVEASISFDKSVGRQVPSPGLTMGLVDLANRLLCHGLVHTRRFITSYLSQQAWWYSLPRISYTDFRKNELAWESKHGPIVDYLLPTVVTPDSSDINWRVAESQRPRLLTTSIRSRVTPHDAADLWLYGWARHGGTREDAVYGDYVQKLVYNGSEPLKWRLVALSRDRYGKYW